MLYHTLGRTNRRVSLLGVINIFTPAAKVVALLAISICTVARGDQRPIDQRLTFERDIRPIFRAHCFDCHGATDELKGGLDLRLVRLMEIGGESGSAITPGDPAAATCSSACVPAKCHPGRTDCPTTKSERSSAGLLTAHPPLVQSPSPSVRGSALLRKSAAFGRFNRFGGPRFPGHRRKVARGPRSMRSC